MRVFFSRPPFSAEISALVEQERALPRLPPPVRARVIARARAARVRGSAAPAMARGAAPGIRWAAAAALACAASATVGAAAYAVRARLKPAQSIPLAAAPPEVVVGAAPPAPAGPAERTGDAPAPARAIITPRREPVDSLRAELRLLRQARAAAMRGDFAAALAPIAEHTRRFKNGRLAEEREALHVQALAGLGRTEEARRAAALFGARFPNSVLLPAIQAAW